MKRIWLGFGPHFATVRKMGTLPAASFGGWGPVIIVVISFVTVLQLPKPAQAAQIPGSQPHFFAAGVPGYYLALANMAGKLLQQFKVGKAQSNCLNPAKNLASAGPNNLFGTIQNKLIRTYQLHRILRFRHICHNFRFPFINCPVYPTLSRQKYLPVSSYCCRPILPRRQFCNVNSSPLQTENQDYCQVSRKPCCLPKLIGASHTSPWPVAEIATRIKKGRHRRSIQKLILGPPPCCDVPLRALPRIALRLKRLSCTHNMYIIEKITTLVN